jgi:hypothetical protein
MLNEAADPKSFSRKVATAIAIANTTKRIPIIRGENRNFKYFIIIIC